MESTQTEKPFAGECKYFLMLKILKVKHANIYVVSLVSYSPNFLDSYVFVPDCAQESKNNIQRKFELFFQVFFLK